MPKAAQGRIVNVRKKDGKRMTMMFFSLTIEQDRKLRVMAMEHGFHSVQAFLRKIILGTVGE